MSPFDDANILNYGDGENLLFADTSPVITTNNTYHTVREGDSLISIAWQYYRDSGQWGLIARANNILNPFTEVKPGDRLLIP